VIFILLTIVVFPDSLAISDNGNQEIISSGHYEKGYRYNIRGWVYVHIEGEPYERGYQYGYLASSEIVDMIHRWSVFGSNNMKIFGLFKIKNQGRFWELCKSKTMRTFEKHYPEEYREEIRGIAEGVKARGGKVHGHDVEYEDIMTLNEFQDCWWYFTYFKKQFHPIRGIFYGIKNMFSGVGRTETEGFCSAFIATGDATSDGGIVASHATAPIPYFMERCNIILDVQPSNGYRFIMTSPPGYIWSNENYYQNEKGIIILETTLPQGPWKRQGTPIAIRLRNAIQYSDSIDDVIETLLKKNNGLYTCEWLIGDTKTGEIASIELALFNTPIKRTNNGFYWSCNVPHDPKVQRETLLGVTERFPLSSKLIPGIYANPVAEKFMEIEKEYYGEVDINVAKKIMATDPICRTRTDCKITDSELMEKLGLLAHMGNPNGSQWNPTDEQKKDFAGITELPASGWVEIYPSKSQPAVLPSTNKINYEEGKSRVLWQYETDFTRNIDYSSSVISEDVVYAASSTGTVYALDADRSKLIWESKIGERAVTPETSNDLVFIGTDEGLHSVDKETGKINWEQLVGDISSKPIITNDLVIASCSDGDIYAFDVNSGKILWKYAFLESAHVSAVKHDNIYVCSGDTCYAFDIADNEMLWEYKAGSPITASPRINGKTVYFGSWDGNICAVDSISGDLRWKYETGWGIDSTPDVSDGTVFVGSLDNNFYALEEETGELKWFFTCNSAIHSSPVTYGEYVFFGCDDGRFYALNKTDGNLAWSFAPGYSINNDNANNYITTPILSSPVAENGVVYFGAKGNVYALDAQTFETPKEKIEETKDYDMILIFITLAAVIVVLLLIYLQSRRKEGGK